MRLRPRLALALALAVAVAVAATECLLPEAGLECRRIRADLGRRGEERDCDSDGSLERTVRRTGWCLSWSDLPAKEAPGLMAVVLAEVAVAETAGEVADVVAVAGLLLAVVVVAAAGMILGWSLGRLSSEADRVVSESSGSGSLSWAKRSRSRVEKYCGTEAKRSQLSVRCEKNSFFFSSPFAVVILLFSRPWWRDR